MAPRGAGAPGYDSALAYERGPVHDGPAPQYDAAPRYSDYVAPRHGEGDGPPYADGPARRGGNGPRHGDGPPPRRGTGPAPGYGNGPGPRLRETAAPHQADGLGHGDPAPRHTDGPGYSEPAPLRTDGPGYGSPAPHHTDGPGYGDPTPHRTPGTGYGDPASLRVDNGAPQHAESAAPHRPQTGHAPPRPGTSAATPTHPGANGTLDARPAPNGTLDAPGAVEAPGEGGASLEEDDSPTVLSLADRTAAIDAGLTRLTAAHNLADLEDREPPVRRARRAGKLALKVPVALLAVLTLAATALGWASSRWMDSTIRTVSALDPGTGVVDAGAQTGDRNLLLLGTASGTSGTPAGAGGRTDTIVLVHRPAAGGKVVAVSLPLGLAVDRPECRQWDAAAATYLDRAVPAAKGAPLSSAYGEGGPRCLVRTVQQLTGLAVTGFVALDVPGLGGMVDAVGGIDVCVERPVREAGKAVAEPGTHPYDGAAAVRLASAPAGPGEPGYAQAQHQQRVLAATVAAGLSPRNLLSPWVTRDFGSALGRSMLADSTTTTELREITSSITDFVSVPGNRDEATALFTALRADRSLPPVTSTSAAPAAGPEPADVTVSVLNASERNGLAGEIGGRLRSLGFGVGEVGNAPAPSADTVVRFSPDRADAAALLGRVVPGARLQPEAAGTGVVQLVLGTSFDGTVKAPETGGQAPAAAPEPAAATCP